jgi:hypothetical protein
MSDDRRLGVSRSPRSFMVPRPMWLHPDQTPPFYGAREGLPDDEGTFALWDTQRSFTSWLLRGVPTADPGRIIDVLLFGIAAVDIPTVMVRCHLRAESPDVVADRLGVARRLQNGKPVEAVGVVVEANGSRVGHVLCGGTAFKQWRGDYWNASAFEQFLPDPTRT